MDEVPDMGFLAEDACRELARALVPTEHLGDLRRFERVKEAFRRFMFEAKRGNLA